MPDHIKEMMELMMQLIEVNSGKTIDESIADGTLRDDVKSAHERFKKERKHDTK